MREHGGSYSKTRHRLGQLLLDKYILKGSDNVI